MNERSHQQDKQRHGELGRVAVKLFLGIAGKWRLTSAQCLVISGHKSASTLNRWRRKVTSGESIKLSRNTLERLSYIAGIYKALQLLFPHPEQWAEWVRRPNHHFGGQTALDHMLGGSITDLADVRRYLDAQLDPARLALTDGEHQGSAKYSGSTGNSWDSWFDAKGVSDD